MNTIGSRTLVVSSSSSSFLAFVCLFCTFSLPNTILHGFRFHTPSMRFFHCQRQRECVMSLCTMSRSDWTHCSKSPLRTGWWTATTTTATITTAQRAKAAAAVSPTSRPCICVRINSVWGFTLLYTSTHIEYSAQLQVCIRALVCWCLSIQISFMWHCQALCMDFDGFACGGMTINVYSCCWNRSLNSFR